MAMATAVANKGKSIMDHMAAVKSALATRTAEVHVQVSAGTFPDAFLAGVMGPEIKPRTGWHVS